MVGNYLLAKVDSRVGGRFEWDWEFWMKDGEEPEPAARGREHGTLAWVVDEPIRILTTGFYAAPS